jgi:hypothetical protein
MIKTNSVLADKAMNKSKREQVVFGVYLEKRESMTDREVMQALGAHDPNLVRPRITGLIEKGILKETGKRICEATNRAVRVVCIDPVHLNSMRVRGELPSEPSAGHLF